MSTYDSIEEERKVGRDMRRGEREKWGKRKEGRRREELGRRGGEERRRIRRKVKGEAREKEGEGEGGGKKGGREKEKIQPMQSYIVGREYERRRWRLMEPVWPSCHEQLPAETGQQKNIKMFL